MFKKLTKKQIRILVNRAVSALVLYCKKHNRHFIVTGVSGGLDSAVVIALASRACKLAKKQGFDLTSVGLIIPCHSSLDSQIFTKKVIAKFGAKEIIINLTDVYDFAKSDVLNNLDKQLEMLKPADELVDRIAQGNVKARLRMALGTYHVARRLSGMVLSTDNLSEYWMGFWTICGDVGDYGMVQNVMKGLELYDVARYLGVPQEILDAKPDDGLGVAGGDEDQLGAPYEVIDKIMIKLIEGGFDINGEMSQLNNLPKINGISKDLVYQIAHRVMITAFKRRGVINLSRQELGLDPIK